MHGQTVCKMHGGKSPLALRKAEELMRELVHPSISRLEQLIRHADQDSVSLNGIKYVLDWAGFHAQESDSSADSSAVHVTVIFDRADQDSTPTLALNGHTPTD